MRRGWWFVALAACADPDAEPTDSEVPDPSDPGTVIPTLPDPETDSNQENPGDTRPPAPTSWGGGYVDVSGEVFGPDLPVVDMGQREPFRSPQHMSGVWVDLDGDGVEEILMSLTITAPGQTTVAQVFRWTGGGLVRDTALEAALPVVRGAWTGGLDLDGDGRPNLVSGDRQLSMFVPDDDGGWVQTWSADADAGPYWVGAATPWDVDHDGWLDLILGRNDCARSFTLMIQTEPGVWEAHDEVWGATSEGGLTNNGVLVATLPTGDDALISVLGAACDFLNPNPGFFVPTGETTTGLPSYDAVDLLSLDATWRLDPAINRAPFTRVAPMGGGYQDLDGDALPELVLTLGYDALVLSKGRADGRFDDATFERGIDFERAPWGGPEVPWSVAFPDVDQDGRPDIFVTVGDDMTTFHWLDGLAVTNNIYWNAGDLTFRDVALAAGAALPGNWRALALDDPDRDGDADLVFGGTGSAARVLRNDVDAGNHGFAVQLAGTTSNPLGLGAHLLVRADGLPEQDLVIGDVANEFALSDPIAFVGIGAATTAEIEVVWPSGYRQVVSEVAAGALHRIVEPELLRVTPTARALPADGLSEAVVRVLPRLIDGAVDQGAAVTATLDGPGEIVSVARAAEGWDVRVRAPSEPGWTWVRVEIGGEALGVAPRLTWR